MPGSFWVYCLINLSKYFIIHYSYYASKKLFPNYLANFWLIRFPTDKVRAKCLEPWAARLRAGHIPAGHRGRQPSHRKLVGTVPSLALEKATLPGVLGGGGQSQTPSIFLAVMGTLPSCPKRGSPRAGPVISGFVSTWEINAESLGLGNLIGTIMALILSCFMPAPAQN